jgi:hypothetical protein
MATIRSGDSTDVLKVDPTSKAARVTLYDTAGNPLASLPVSLDSASLAALESITATISGPVALDSATLTAQAAQFGTDGAAAPTIAGTGVRGWLRAIFDRLTAGIGRTWNLSSGSDSVTIVPSGTQTVSGPLTNTELRATAVAVSGPVTDAQLRASAVPVSLSGVGTAEATPAFVFERPANMKVAGVSAANTAQTITLPAAGAGQSHYIVGLHVGRYNSTATAVAAAAANLAVTTTNLGSLQWRRGNAVAAGAGDDFVNWLPSNPIKADAANTATTIVIPALGAGIVSFANVVYFTAP